MKSIEQKLWVSGDVGGIARFNDDPYMRASDDFTGNAWFICTLWLADYRIAAAKLTGLFKYEVETWKRSKPPVMVQASYPLWKKYSEFFRCSA